MTTFLAVALGAALGGPPQFGGTKTTWHGFDRHDFLMDEADLTVKPHTAGADEGTRSGRR